MLFAIIFGEDGSDYAANMQNLLEQCLEQAGRHNSLPYEVLHVFEDFSTETDNIIKRLRSEATGLLFVARGRDLWKSSIGNFTLQMCQAHPRISLTGTPAGIIVDRDGTFDILTLATRAIESLTELHADVQRPALSVNEGATLIIKLHELLSAKAA